MDLHDLKYDRQLRIWQTSGQNALESATVCLVGATALGAEALKNLILPGIKAFTIIDDAQVTSADCENNFFLVTDDIGKNRAECMTKRLVGLNDNCAGKTFILDPQQAASQGDAFFKQFSVVISTAPFGKHLVALDKLCWSIGVPLISTKTNGLFGYLRVSLKEFPSKHRFLRHECGSRYCHVVN